MNRGRNAGGSHYNRYRENPSYEDTPYSRNTRTSNTDHDPIQNQRYQSYDRQRDERVYDWSTKSWDNQNARSSKRNYQAQQSPRSLERQNYNDTREMTVSGHAQDHGRYDQGGYSNPYTRGRGAFYGQAPKGYTRSDEKIQEEVCEALTRADNIDKSDIEVKVKDGEVILSGSVQERWDKRRAEDICDSVMGVRNTQNNLKMSEKSDSDRNSTSKQSTSTSKNRTD
jgi:osmotically-inducible protein OsmY